jgi:transcriptional regulator with XRE-family HTH domain
MSTQVNIRELGALIRAKRGSRGLREVASEIGGVSASTMSRVEQGKVPDLDTFMRLCKWLNVSPDEFMQGKASIKNITGSTTSEMITAHLRTDRTLDPDTAEALAKMIQLAYAAANKGKIGKK